MKLFGIRTKNKVVKLPIAVQKALIVGGNMNIIKYYENAVPCCILNLIGFYFERKLFSSSRKDKIL